MKKIIFLLFCIGLISCSGLIPIVPMLSMIPAQSTSSTPSAPPAQPNNLEHLGTIDQLAIEHFNEGLTLFSYPWNNYIGAVEEFSEAIRLDPNFAEAFYYRGIAHSRLNTDYINAINDINEAIRLNPNLADRGAFFYRGRAYELAGDYESAIADFIEAQKRISNNISINDSDIVFFMTRSQESLQWEHFVIEQQNQRLYLENYHYNRGFAYYEEGDFTNAIIEFNETLKINRNHPEAFLYRGLSYFETRDYNRSISDISNAIQLNPVFANENILIRRGLAHLETRDFFGAINDFSEVIRINPNSSGAYNNRGLVYQRIGDNTRAISDYTEAIRLNPNFAIAYYNRGSVYQQINNNDRAISDYIEALRFDPEHIMARANLENLQRIAELDAVAAEERRIAEQARQAAQQAEQDRLAALYRQAGNSLGNLRNTSWRFFRPFSNTYEEARIDFGDGSYIIQQNQHDYFYARTYRGTYRVSGENVIFLSSDGVYTSGIITGNALEYGTGVLGNRRVFNRTF